MKKAFTLVELMVAVGILAIILSFSGVVFHASIDTYRIASANSEVMRNFRAITDQLDSDFEGLRKDGEIFVVWVAKPQPAPYDPCDPNSYERFDRIMFFADGDFQSYGTSPMIRGNVARISYMLATKGSPGSSLRAESQTRRDRLLTRTQHILTSDADATLLFDPNSFSDLSSPDWLYWYNWHNRSEYDKMATSDDLLLLARDYESLSLEEWKHIPWYQKQDMLAVIMDIDIDFSVVPSTPDFRGAHMDLADPNSIHMLLCEGVGEFKIQGWYDRQRRWVPEVDPDADGVLADSDFFLGDRRVSGVLYPHRTAVGLWGVLINGLSFPRTSVSEANFNNIPGLGRALKFTFTLYDSKGIIEQGRTFTHIIYLDK